MEVTGLLDTILFAGVTLKQLLIYAGGFFAFVILWSIVRRLFAGEKTNPHNQTARCKECGWQGQISRYAGKCPQCSAPLGDRKSDRS